MIAYTLYEIKTVSVRKTLEDGSALKLETRRVPSGVLRQITSPGTACSGPYLQTEDLCTCQYLFIRELSRSKAFPTTRRPRPFEMNSARCQKLTAPM